eukprot:887593-Amphidinium_carterae.2
MSDSGLALIVAVGWMNFHKKHSQNKRRDDSCGYDPTMRMLGGSLHPNIESKEDCNNSRECRHSS